MVSVAVTMQVNGSASTPSTLSSRVIKIRLKNAWLYVRRSDKWVESDQPAADLEDYLLELKAVEIDRRDAQNERRVKWSKRAFAFLPASLVAALLVAGINAIAPTWSDNAEQQRVEAPASPEAIVAP